MVPLVFVAYLAIKWHNLHWVQNLVIRWRHLHCLESWPPGCVTCIAILPWIAQIFVQYNQIPLCQLHGTTRGPKIDTVKSEACLQPWHVFKFGIAPYKSRLKHACKKLAQDGCYQTSKRPPKTLTIAFMNAHHQVLDIWEDCWINLQIASYLPPPQTPLRKLPNIPDPNGWICCACPINHPQSVTTLLWKSANLHFLQWIIESKLTSYQFYELVQGTTKFGYLDEYSEKLQS